MITIDNKINKLYTWLKYNNLKKEANAINFLRKNASDYYKKLEEEMAKKREGKWSEAIDAIMEHSPGLFASRPQYLTGGTEADVFVSGDKILKFTTSGSEASIASALKGNPYPGVYDVYEVFKSRNAEGRTSWGLAVEKLDSQDADMYAAGSVIWGMVDGRKGASNSGKGFIFKSDKNFYDVIDKRKEIVNAEAKAGGTDLGWKLNSKIKENNLMSEEEMLAYINVVNGNKNISSSQTELRGESVSTKNVLENGSFVQKEHTEYGALDYLDKLRSSIITKHMQDLKTHLKYINDTFGITITDISGGNYGSRNGEIVLLDLGRSGIGSVIDNLVDLTSYKSPIESGSLEKDNPEEESEDF
jgi:hypothetical protein